MFSFIEGTLVYGITAPALVAGIIAAIAWRPWSDNEGGYWGTPVGVAGGYLVAHWGLDGDPSAMPYLVTGVGLLGLIEAFWVPDREGGDALRRVVVWGLRLAAVPVITYVVAGYMFDSEWTGVYAMLWPALFAAAAASLIGGIDRVGERHPGATAPIAAVVLSATGALVLALTGTARVGELMGALTAAAGGTMLVAIWDSSYTPARGGVSVFALLFSALAIFGYAGIFGENQTIAGAALLALASLPHLTRFQRVGSLTDLSGWRGTAARVLPLAFGAGLVAGTVWFLAG